MNSRKLYKVLVMGMLFIGLCNCSMQNPIAITPTTYISSFPYYSTIQFEDVNQSIKLSLYPSQIKKLSQNASIKLLLENTSEKQIVFSLDWREKIYQYWNSTSSWHEIENRVTYAGKAITLSPKGDKKGINFFQISAIPSLTQGESERIRILVSGNSMPSNKPVLAYIDLLLQP